jgi:hypothetical protein
METNIPFDNYMEEHFEFSGQWGTPSKCGLKIVRRKDGKTLAIATEIYRQNPGTPVTEWVAPLATEILKHTGTTPSDFLFIEHTPDLKSRLTFYGETFDLLDFDWDGAQFTNPRWTRLTADKVNQLMGE